jgi:hypothetical protein
MLFSPTCKNKKSREFFYSRLLNDKTNKSNHEQTSGAKKEKEENLPCLI